MKVNIKINPASQYKFIQHTVSHTLVPLLNSQMNLSTLLNFHPTSTTDSFGVSVSPLLPDSLKGNILHINRSLSSAPGMLYGTSSHWWRRKPCINDSPFDITTKRQSAKSCLPLYQLHNTKPNKETCSLSKCTMHKTMHILISICLNEVASYYLIWHRF
jgi:hypothetical protein